MSKNILTLGVGQDAVERREVAWARGDSEGVVLREAASLGNTCTPREIMESGIYRHKNVHQYKHPKDYEPITDIFMKRRTCIEVIQVFERSANEPKIKMVSSDG